MSVAQHDDKRHEGEIIKKKMFLLEKEEHEAETRRKREAHSSMHTRSHRHTPTQRTRTHQGAHALRPALRSTARGPAWKLPRGDMRCLKQNMPWSVRQAREIMMHNVLLNKKQLEQRAASQVALPPSAAVPSARGPAGPMHTACPSMNDSLQCAPWLRRVPLRTAACPPYCLARWPDGPQYAPSYHVRCIRRERARCVVAAGSGQGM